MHVRMSISQSNRCTCMTVTLYSCLYLYPRNPLKEYCTWTAGPLKLTNLVLSGFSLPSPAQADPEALMRPMGLIRGDNSSSRLHLQDVRIIIARASLQQHVAFLRSLVDDGRAYTVSTCMQTTTSSCMALHGSASHGVAWHDIQVGLRCNGKAGDSPIGLTRL